MERLNLEQGSMHLVEGLVPPAVRRRPTGAVPRPVVVCLSPPVFVVVVVVARRAALSLSFSLSLSLSLGRVTLSLVPPSPPP